MKNKVILIVIATIMLIGICVYIKKTDIPNNPTVNKVNDEDIINGQYVSSNGTAEYLFDFKTSYEDNLTIKKLLDIIDIRMYGQYTFNLQTIKKQGILKIDYSQAEGWVNILRMPELMTEKSAILLALIDDVDEIHWIAKNKTHKITTSDLKDNYGNIKDYGKSLEVLKKLLIKIGYFEGDGPITISIKEGELTNVELTLIIKNHTTNNYHYGEGFSIEYKKDEKWIDFEPLVRICDFDYIGYNLEAEQEIEKQVSWEHCYGRLPKGQYRIIKDFSYISPDTDSIQNEKKYIVSAEFSI